MIKKFIDKLLGKGPAANHAKAAAADFGKRVEVGPAVHGIDPDLVDERARNVVATLRQAGYEAYIVGGAVRDLLLGLKPKDFDVATNATPEQVKGLFRRAFIIGRRFRIVHVVYGRGREHEVIEVSTFRAYLDSADAETVSGNERTAKSELAAMKHAVDASGRVLRDNVWGSQIEDAARRDFTINAMYYEPSSQIVVDYHRGIRDAERHVLRMIGDPATRYREDPVRIIRAARFAAKLAALGFRLDPKTAAPLQRSLPLLAQVPQSRLFDEMLKLLQTGHALATIAELRELGVAHGIYPLLDLVVDRADQPFVHAALQDTDRRVDEGKPVAPSFLLACVLWADVRDGWSKRIAAGQPSFPALQDAIDEVFDARIGDVSGRGRLAGDMREIWMMQPRFDKRSGNTPRSLVEQPRFRAGFDFLRLRADTGEVDEALAAWWQEFSIADEDGRAGLLEQVRAQPRAVRRRRGRAGSSDAQQATDEAGIPPSQDATGADRDPGTPHAGEMPNGAPKKRRRRRRSNASINIASSTDNTGATS
ncbi:MAG: polynucleotide adenylyltransferase PcnB [Proteobacteria bacterium]|nr:polynucleotide adenylyltransferase PcnB [Pseudomonadota bacterium]